MALADIEHDWDAGTYDRFRRLRLRPVIHLLSDVPDALPPGPVVDLGCGTGAAGPLLRERFPGRRLIGLDGSAAMLAGVESGIYDDLDDADIAAWVPEEAPALILSNAVLHWLPDHAALFPRLAGFLAPGGLLAVQMPRQFGAPSHRLIEETAARLFPDRFAPRREPPVAPPEMLQAILAPLGDVSVWESEYLHVLDATEDGSHPVRAFTRSTAALPVLAQLDAGERARFFDAYDAALSEVYSPASDGRVMMPFRRQFAVLTV
ncbi:methyltransferase domain-containing protein [Pontivivens ytuae]|uniref:Methyltransferase domain-containing protein n=1 Tax=Pontivivens ytuae TaxID=2789856 RepID=A0A7S9LUU6_9RHOB|nr:methyltransferase domain-containing protein [Pontivivens ytuae]QPH55674.1 methyltransferase domain-containing protein [Pontivivens ytuae]